MSNILFTISLILFTLITIYKTRLGIYLILILIPSFLIRTQILGIPTTFLELSIYLLAIIWLFKKLKFENWKIGNLLKIENCKLKIFILPIVLFILAALISTIISPDKRLSLGILKGWFFNPLLFLIIFIDQIRTHKHIRWVVASLSLIILWLSGYGIAEYFIAPKNLIEYLRLDSFFTSANYVTMLTVPITVLLLGYIILTLKQYNNIKIEQKNNKTKKQLEFSSFCFLVFLFSCFLISTTAIYLTRSYSGWLGLGVGLFILLLLIPTKRKIKFSVITILIILSTFFLYTQKSNPKIQALTDFTGRTAIHSRVQIWKTSTSIIKDNPILGIGLGNFHEKYLEYLPKTIKTPLEYAVIKPHNLYLNLWLETGLLGLVSFIWLIVNFYRINLKKSIINYPSQRLVGLWPKLSIINISAMTALLTQGLFDTPYFKNDLSMLFWILIGLIIISRRDARVVE